MARNKNNSISGDFDLDKELDFRGFEFDDLNVKDDRKPAIKIATGALKGAKAKARDTAFLKQTLKNVLPRGYGQSMDLADNVAKSVKALYDESAKEIKPAIKETKRTLNKLISKDSKLVPKSVLAMMKRWEEEEKREQRGSAPSKDYMRESMVASQMTDIFKATMLDRSYDRAQADGKDRLREGMEMHRHKEISNFMFRQTVSLDRMEKYQSNITLGYQKKSLELQYRNLFAIQDLLEHAKEDAKQRDSVLLAISKNTSLPDAIKINSKEATEQVGRNKFNESIYRGLFGGRDAFIEKTLKTISDRALGSVREVTGGLRAGLGMVDMGAEMGAGMDPYSTSGEFLGGGAMSVLGGQVGGRLVKTHQAINRMLTGGKFGKVGKKIINGGKNLEYINENVGQKVNAFRKSKQWDWDDSLKGKGMRFMQSMIPGMGPDMSTDVSKGKDMESPFYITKRTDRSINEIIPGYLSRILRELQVTRTGNDKIELTAYNFDRGQFTSKGKNEAAAFKSIISSDAAGRTQKQLDKLLDQIDPERKLSGEARQALKKKLLTNSAEFNEANKENLGMYASYSNIREGLADEIVPLMRDFLKGLDGDSRTEFARRNNALAGAVSDPRAAIQQQINLGNIQYLKKMGLVDKTGQNIDMKKVIEYMLDPKLVSSIQVAATGKGPGGGGKAFQDMAKQLKPSTSVLGKMNDVKTQVMDVFVAGEVVPRMLAAKMSAGLYRDKATQAIITHQSQIAGVVEDISTNNVVVEAGDISKLAFVNAKTKSLEALKLAKDFSSEQYAKIISPNSLPGKAIQMGYDKVKSVIADNVEKVTDVYVNGESAPRMIAAKMTAGLYRDQETGKQIFHQSEINGPVIDDDNKIVVSAEDIPSLQVWYVERKRFGKIKFIGKMALALAKGLWWFQTKVAVPWTKWNFKMLGVIGKGSLAITKRVLGIGIGPVRDVYVGSEPNPRLYAARIKAGDYRVRATGERINHQNDITGEIIDRDDQVVLSDDDMPHLKVYNSILRIFSPFKLIGKLIKGVGKAAWWVQKKGIALSVKLLKGLGSVASKGTGMVVRYLSKATDVYVLGESKPKLRGSVMKAGGYISWLTKKIISVPSDIDGEVRDEENQVVLTDDEVKRGLVDVTGKPIKTGALGALKNSLKALNKLFSRRVSLPMVKRGPSTAAILKSKTVTAGDKTVVLLQDVRAILDKAFNKKSMFGDSDGDGDRDGSWQDKMKNRVGKALGRAGLPGGAAAAAKKKDEKEEEGTSLLDLLDGASDAKDLLGGRGRKGRGLGRLLKGGRLAGGLKLAAGGALMGAAAYGVDGLAGKAGIGKDSIDEEQDNRNWERASTLEKVQSGLGRGIEKAGSFLFMDNLAKGARADRIKSETAYLNNKDNSPGSELLSYLKMPVPLGLAFGGIALASSLFGSKNPVSAFSKLRYVQYGFKENDSSFSGKISQLEDYLIGLIHEGGGGIEINEAKLDIKKMMQPFGLDHTDKKQMQLFFEWYQNRFKPVFLTHVIASANFAGKPDLFAGSKLKGEQLSKFFDAVSFLSGPYEYATLPTLDKSLIASSQADVKALVEKMKTDMSIAAKGGKSGVAATATGAAAAVTVGATGKPGMQATSATSILGQPNKLPNVTVAAVSTVGTSSMPTTGRISALDAVRYKAYGLVEMDSEKVISLHLLEREVRKGVTFDGDNVGSWKGNPIEILQKVTGAFGIGDIYGKEANNWAIWFRNRFLPVFTGYLSGFRVLTGKEDNGQGAFMLKPEQQVQLAKIVVGISGAWSEKTSPWPNYNIGTDSTVTKPNIALLEDTAKETKVEEAKKMSSAPSNVGGAKESFSFKKVLSSINPFSSKPEAYTPDAEVQVKGTSAGATKSGVGTSSASGIPLAGGPLSDGRNALAYLNIKKGVSLDRMNPAVLKNFYGMAEEYGLATGKKVGVNDGFRTYEDQVAAKKKYGARAAEPGTSLHEYGLALDIDPAALDEMDKMGLMRKYGFTRPVGGEAWHMEPIGIQGDISGYKNNLNRAISAVEAGVGKGGGGLGTVSNAPLYSRNADLSKAIMAGTSTPNVDNSKNAAGSPAGPAQVAVGPVGSAAAPSAPSGSSVPSGAGANPNINRTSFGYGASVDGEAKPATGSSGSSLTTGPRNSSMASDPSIKVPAATGNGVGGLKDTIVAAAKMVGVDPNIMLKTAAIESGFNSTARADGSSASGLFQFTNDTWRAVMDKYGRKYGMSAATTSPNDPRAAAIMAAHYIKETTESLSRKVKRAIGATEAYLGHFLGGGGAATFLTALERDPNTIGATLMPEAARANQNIFYQGGRALTVSEIYSNLDNKVRERARSFGINTADAPTTVVASRSISPSTGSMPTLPNQPSSGMMQTSYKPASAPSAGALAPTNQAGSPISDSYGFRPMQASTQLAPSGQPSQMSKSVMEPTESLLAQSLEVQKQMRDILQNLFGIVSNDPAAVGSVGSAPGTAVKPPAEYSVPKPPVSMKRIGMV